MEALEGLLLPGYLPFPSSLEPRVVEVVNMQLNIRIAKLRQAVGTIAGGSSCALHFEAVEGCAKMQLFSQTPELRAQLRSQRLAAQQERALHLARLEAQRQLELQQAQAERVMKQQQEALANARRLQHQQQQQQPSLKSGSGVMTWHALDSSTHSGGGGSSQSTQSGGGVGGLGLVKNAPWGGESLKLRPGNTTNTSSSSSSLSTGNIMSGSSSGGSSSSPGGYDNLIYSIGIGLAQQQQQQQQNLLFGSSHPQFEAPLQQQTTSGGGWGSPLRLTSSSPQHLKEQRTSSSPEPLSSLHIHPSQHHSTGSMSLGLSANFASAKSSSSSGSSPPSTSPGLHASASPPAPGPIPGGSLGGGSSSASSSSGQAFKLAAKGFTGLSLTKGKGFAASPPSLPPNQ
jgi:hypothetical protein